MNSIHDILLSHNSLLHKELEVILDIHKVLSGTFLHIGCGVGTTINHFKTKYSVHGIDTFHDNAEIGGILYPDISDRFIIADLNKLPLRHILDHAFDVILCSWIGNEEFLKDVYAHSRIAIFEQEPNIKLQWKMKKHDKLWVGKRDCLIPKIAK